MISWSLCSWSSRTSAWDGGSLTWWKTRPWLMPWKGLVSASNSRRPLLEVAACTGLATLAFVLERGWWWGRGTGLPSTDRAGNNTADCGMGLVTGPFVPEKWEGYSGGREKAAFSLNPVPDATGWYCQSPCKSQTRALRMCYTGSESQGKMQTQAH